MVNEPGDVPIENEDQEVDAGLEDDVAADDLIDEEPLTPGDLDETVQYTLDWSVQSLLERVGTTFDVNPSFQRRDAWTRWRKSLYIESLMLGLPVPQVVLAEDPSSRGRFIVLDGKQRLITLKQFAAPDKNFPAFALRQLEFLPELNGMTFDDLQNSLSGHEYAESLLAQPVRTIVVRNWRTPAVLYQIFLRLNQNSVALSPQELRQALYPGAFTSWINDRSRESRPIHEARRMRGEDFRMRDAEMLLRFIALSDDLASYSGNLRAFLDEACKTGNARWDRDSDRYLDLAKDCEKSIDVVDRVFASDAFMRFREDRYVRRFNIAVFDAMTLVFSSAQIEAPDINDSLAGELKGRFEQLCVTDSWFQESLISTTKSPRNTFGRVAIWGKVVSELIDRPIPLAEAADRLASSVS